MGQVNVLVAIAVGSQRRIFLGKNRPQPIHHVFGAKGVFEWHEVDFDAPADGRPAGASVCILSGRSNHARRVGGVKAHWPSL